MPVRRDGEGNATGGPTWESITERLIREAMERGEFDELPHRGEPLPLDDYSAAGDMALAFHVLKNAGAAPPWIEADKEARRLLGERDAILDAAMRTGTAMGRERLRRRLRQTVEAANLAIAELNSEAPSPAQHRRRLRLDDELAALERRLSNGGT